MKSDKYKILILVIWVFALSMQCFCSPLEDYTRSVLNDISNNIKKTNKNNVIYSWERVDRTKNDIKGNDFPCPVGKDTTSITRCQKLDVYYLGNNYAFKYDEEGHRAIAYHDLSIDAPMIVYQGFYIVDKIDAITHEVKKCRYCVDDVGYMISGWIKEKDGTRYYMSEESETFGEAVTGDMLFSDGKVYSFNGDGALISVR